MYLTYYVHLVGIKRSEVVKCSYVSTIRCILHMKCMFTSVLSSRRVVADCLELSEHTSSIISVFRVPTLQFLTNASSISVIGQAPEDVLPPLDD